MNLTTIDYETFWSDTHSLTKMLPMTYVMHPDTEIISCSFKFGKSDTIEVFGEDEVRYVFEHNKNYISNSMMIAHNMSGFDSMIASWRFGAKPKMWGCTLAMARPIHGVSVGGSLAKLVAHYAKELQAMGISPVKDNTALVQTKGKRLKDFTAEEIEAMRVYNGNDTDQCYGLFQLMKGYFDPSEFWQIDANIRQLIEPAFVLNSALLQETLVKERQRKADAINKVADVLGLFGDDVEEQVRAGLSSSVKFAKILVSQGVDVPMKVSPTNPDKLIPALSKTDEAFIELTSHNNEVVCAAAQARLAVKSTILETRIQAFEEAAAACGGLLPVPLNYCGAATTGRDSGWVYNPQNLPRIDPSKPKLADALRESMGVKPGDAVAVADLSGIELRVNHFLWKVASSMALYRASPDKADLYKDFASTLYSVAVDAVTKPQRQIGKVAHLGLGFGAGAATFQKVAKIMGGVDITLQEAEEVVAKWRAAYAEIAQGWRTCHSALDHIYAGNVVAVDPWGLVHTCKEGLRLPSGRLIRYPNLRRTRNAEGKAEWVYGKDATRIYAGKVDENIVQALARDILKGYKLQVFLETGRRTALDVHDELVYVLPESKAHDHLATVQRIMRTPPAWWPQLVTWSEGDVAHTYGAAK